MKQQSEQAEASSLLLLFDSLSKTLDEMRWSPHQRFTLEVGLIKACSISALRPITEMLERVTALEGRLASKPGLASPEETIREQPAAYTSSKENSEQQKGRTQDEQGDTWKKLLALLKDQKPSLASALSHSRLAAIADEEIVIGVVGSSFQMDLAGKREHRSVVEQAASALLNRNVQVRFQHLGEMEKPAGKTSATKRKNF